MPPLEKNEIPNAFEPVNSTAVDLKASLSPASQARALDGPEFYWLQHTLPRDSACAEAGGAISLTHLTVCVCETHSCRCYSSHQILLPETPGALPF